MILLSRITEAWQLCKHIKVDDADQDGRMQKNAKLKFNFPLCIPLFDFYSTTDSLLALESVVGYLFMRIYLFSTTTSIQQIPHSVDGNLNCGLSVSTQKFQAEIYSSVRRGENFPLLRPHDTIADIQHRILMEEKHSHQIHNREFYEVNTTWWKF